MKPSPPHEMPHPLGVQREGPAWDLPGSTDVVIDVAQEGGPVATGATASQRGRPGVASAMVSPAVGQQGAAQSSLQQPAVEVPGAVAEGDPEAANSTFREIVRLNAAMEGHISRISRDMELLAAGAPRRQHRESWGADIHSTAADVPLTQTTDGGQSHQGRRTSGDGGDVCNVERAHGTDLRSPLSPAREAVDEGRWTPQAF